MREGKFQGDGPAGHSITFSLSCHSPEGHCNGPVVFMGRPEL